MFSMFTPVGARRLEHRAAPRRARAPTPTGSSTGTTSSRRTSSGSVIDRQVIGPYDMEQDLGLIGGNIFHGELLGGSAVPHAPGARLRGLPHADQGPVPRVLRHARRRRRQRHPRLAGVQAWPKKDKALPRRSSAWRRNPAADPTAGPRSSACSRRGRSPSSAPASSEGSLGEPDAGRAAPRRVRRRDLPGQPRLRRGPGSALLPVDRRRARAGRPRDPRGVANARIEQALTDAAAAGAR